MQDTRNHRRLLIAIAILGLLLAGAFGFTAANTVPDTKAGDGSGTITGYTITNVHYTLNGTDGSIIDAIDFDVDSTPVAGSTIKVQAYSAGVFYDCTNTATAVTCDTTGTQLNVVDTDTLRVIIAD